MATTAVVDPFAVPEVIDAAYVDRVLAALNKVEGDLVREFVEKNTLDVQASTRLRAIYNDPQFEEELDSAIKSFATDIGTFKRPPGDRVTTVTELVATSTECILVKVVHDYSSVVVAPRPQEADKVRILTLRPTQANADPTGLNRTRWSVSNAEVIKIDQPPPPRATCDAS